MPAGNLLPTMQNPIPMRSQVGFLIPHSWKSDHKFIDHIGWYMTRFGLQMDKATEENWLTMQKMANLKEPNWERELLIHVRSESNQGTVPLINLTKYDLDAHSSMYDSRKVSGIPCRLESHGVVLMKQTGLPLGLIKSSLMSAHNFTQKDLQMFAAFNELDGMHSNDDVFLLDILGNHLKDEDDSYPDLIKKKYTECTCTTSMLLRDPLMEMVFEDMDEDVLLWRGPSADNQ